MSMLSRMATLSGITTQTYVDDVFNTYLYSGNGGTQTITNGIDLAGQGGIVWVKIRDLASGHALTDTVRGPGTGTNSIQTNILSTQSTNGIGGDMPSGSNDYLSSFNSNGFTVIASNGSNNGTKVFNRSGQIYAAWTFRKATKFFDVVTYTGTGANRTISHSLGTEPGMIFVKRTDSAGDWQVYHRSMLNTEYMVLNTTAAKATDATRWNSTTATSSVFSVGTHATVNASGGTYVAYVFAHDEAPTGLIQCGSFTTDASGNATVNLGWEPQYILYKPSATVANWAVVDIDRGMSVGLGAGLLQPNLTNVESTTSTLFSVSPNGVFIDTTGASTAYVYMAIRRSNKPPTTANTVFNPTLYTGTNVDNRLVNTGILTDMALIRQRNDTALGGFVQADRLRGQAYLLTGTTAVEVNDADSLDQQLSSGTEYGTAFSAMNGFWVGNDATAKLNINTTANNHVAYAFRRAPGFFDMVCYTGTGLGENKSHTLGVKPELMLIRRRTTAGASMFVTESVSSNTTVYFSRTQTTDAFAVSTAGYPTATTFGTTSGGTDVSGDLHVAYLFASVPGISKVGKYVGNGSSQTINCGFTTGARFVLIKRTDSTGDWYVFDTARGIVAGNDPLLRLNSTAAESSAADIIDVDNSGFIINQESTAGLNSTVGSAWVDQLNPGFGTDHLRSVAYANGLWVAVADTGKIGTGVYTDGSITWTQQTSSFGSTNIFDVAYGNGLWIAVGQGSKIATSPDGITWTQRTNSFSTNIRGVAYGNGLWVAVANAGQLATSSDGITWTQRTSSFSTTDIMNVAYGNGLWIAVGASGKIATSSDGITWTQRTSGLGGATTIYDIAYGNGLWAAAAAGGNLITSSDGITWTSRTSSFSTTDILAINYSSGVWIATGGAGKIALSYDGTTWTQQTSSSVNGIQGVAQDGLNYAVAVCASGEIIVSTAATYLYLAIA